MANWSVLKTAVANIINTNGNQEITGQLLQNVLNNIITNVGENSTFAGIATVDTNPGAPDGPVFYLATTAGTYPNFNSLEVLEGEAVILLWDNGTWTKKESGFATQEKLSELGAQIGNFEKTIYANTISASERITFELKGVKEFVILAPEKEANITQYSLGIFTTQIDMIWAAKDASKEFAYKGESIEKIEIFIPSACVSSNGNVTFKVKSGAALREEGIKKDINDLKAKTSQNIDGIKDIKNKLGTKPLFLLQSLNGQTGEQLDSLNRATSIFLRTEDFISISYSSDYTNAQTVYYNDSKVPVKYILNDTNNEGLTVINKGYKYFKITVKRVDKGNINETDKIEQNVIFNISEYSKQIEEINSNLGTKPTFRIGSLNGQTGEHIESLTLATSTFIKTDDIDAVKYNEGYTNAQTVYYNDSKVPVKYILNDTNKEGLTVINKGYKYFKITVKRVDKGNISIEEVLQNVIFHHSKKQQELNSLKSKLGYYKFEESTKAGEYKLLADIYYETPITTLEIKVDEDTALAYSGIKFTLQLLKNGEDVTYIPKAISGNSIVCTHTSEFDEVKLSIAGSLSIDGTFRGHVYTEVKKDVEDLKIKIERLPFTNKIEFLTGFIRFNGTGSTIDTNWIITPYITTDTRLNIFVRTKESNLSSVAVVSYYNENKELIKEASYSQYEIKGIFKPNTDYPYYRICGMSPAFGDYEPYAYSEKSYTIQNLDCITPKNVYCVVNDVKPNSAYNRNYTPCVYLDHFFLGATKEGNVTFKKNNNVVIPFRFPSKADSNWNETLNNGVDYVVAKETHTTQGDVNIDFDINVISTKASVGKDKSVRLLCLGTSTTYGEGATFLSNGMSGVKPYHAICHELFKMDEVEFSGNTNFFTIGTLKHSLNFNFNGQSYEYEDYHEGYRGYSIARFISMAKFVDGNGKFSILSYLDKYRNYNDDGTPMSIVDSNIGTEVTASNINSIRVCTPTHILVQLGANGGGTYEQYKEIIDTIKSELPDVKVALAINDPMGTIFPSKYEIKDKRYIKWEWLNTDDNSSHHDPNRHKLCFNVQRVYNEHFDNDEYKSKGVYVLPFFFSAKPTYFASRRADNPESVAVEDSGYNIMPSGWYSNIHSDIRAHANYAYQLYSWIKYTLAIQ